MPTLTSGSFIPSQPLRTYEHGSLARRDLGYLRYRRPHMQVVQMEMALSMTIVCRLSTADRLDRAITPHVSSQLKLQVRVRGHAPCRLITSLPILIRRLARRAMEVVTRCLTLWLPKWPGWTSRVQLRAHSSLPTFRRSSYGERQTAETNAAFEFDDSKIGRSWLLGLLTRRLNR